MTAGRARRAAALRPLGAAVRALLLASLLAGCGYRFTGGGGHLPGGLRSVCAPVLVNKTSEPGLEAFYTEDLRQVLLHAGVLSTGACDGRIEGELLRVDAGPTVLSTSGDLASYRLVVTAQLRVVQGTRTLAETIVQTSDDFLPAREHVGDVLETERARQQVLRRLGEPLMRDGYERLSSGW